MNTFLTVLGHILHDGSTNALIPAQILVVAGFVVWYVFLFNRAAGSERMWMLVPATAAPVFVALCWQLVYFGVHPYNIASMTATAMRTSGFWKFQIAWAVGALMNTPLVYTRTQRASASPQYALK